MKKNSIALALFLAVALTTPAVAQSQPETVSVKLTDPSKPAHLSIHIIQGAIEVEGYNGQEVIVQAIPEDDGDMRPERPMPPKAPKAPRAEDDETMDRRAGLTKISGGGRSFSVSESDNEVRVRTNVMHSTEISLKIKVPVRSSLKLQTMGDGDVVVDNIEGELELGNADGSIKATRVAGTVLAQTLDGDIVVEMKKVDASKPMSFSTMDGDIDLTLPSSTKANLKVSTPGGDLYTDFDFDVDQTTERNNESDEDGFKMTIMSKVLARINGGGLEINFKTYDGDVMVRKAN